jgi:hypothetical protein
MSHRHMEFKSDVARNRYHCMHSHCIEIAEDMAEWCEERKVPFVITETVSTPGEDLKLQRVSSTHRTGRAFDISLRGWLEKAICEFMDHFEDRYKHLAAIGKKTGEPELLVRHIGTADHIHVQIGVPFAIKDPLKKA